MCSLRQFFFLFRTSMNPLVSAIKLLSISLVLVLSACGGTVKIDPRSINDSLRVEGVSQVSIDLTPEAKVKQAENLIFSRDELASQLRRRLESKGLIGSGAAFSVEILITDIRVRSGFSAIMFGFLAGDDHISGKVRLLNKAGQPVRSFEVNASYAFGGVAGGQDGARMNWLYDKFSELAQIELEKNVMAARPGSVVATSAAGIIGAVPGGGASPGATASSAPALTATGSNATVASVAPSVGPNLGSGGVKRVPYLSERGQEYYLAYLALPGPKAFAISVTGYWRYAQFVNANIANRSADPKLRAIENCREAANGDCVLYAVDNDVVFGGGSVAGSTAGSPAQASSSSRQFANADHVPFLSAKGKEGYREWIARPLPRAFAVAANGHYWAAYGDTPGDASLPIDIQERALAGCAKNAGQVCKLYAVNERVVWPD
jgi:Domain of unknown function (DUF4410)